MPLILAKEQHRDVSITILALWHPSNKKTSCIVQLHTVFSDEFNSKLTFVCSKKMINGSFLLQNNQHMRLVLVIYL